MSYKIVYGDRTFTAKDIKEGHCFIGNSIAGDELTIDTLDVTVKSFDTQFFPLTDSDGYLLCDSNGHFLVARPRLDDLTQYVYGEPVYYYHDDVLIGKFFLSSVMRVGLIHYKLSCISGVGLLDNTQHYGGMYTGQALSDVVADIISGTVEYSIDEAYQSIPVYNWLPIGTRRENLHQLLFVTGLALKKDANGIIRITALTDSDPTEIEESRLFSGGSIDYNTPSTAVSVAEHTYIAFASDETATLFSGEAAAEDIITPNGVKVSGVLVPFDDPIHDLQIDNGEILESGVNYAVLAQSSDCLLTGQKYTHIVREILRGEAGASKDNTATVTDATLVNLANSENVAERVLAYYSKARTVSNDLVVGTERPGDPISMDDPFGDPMTGIIKSMDINISNLLRAQTEFVEGYTPTGIGNYYEHLLIITEDGTVTIPAEAKGRVRLVLISGGQGGASGEKGADGTNDSQSDGNGGKPGAGGKAGKGGSGGRIYIATIPVTPGQTFAVKIGRGGVYGFYSEDGSEEGSFGGDTTFGEYSTANGRASETGFVEMFSGAVYGLPGDDGVDGGNGSGEDKEGESVVYNGVTYTPGAQGETARYESSKMTVVGIGGYGGGAAAGHNGKDGDSGSATYNGGNGYGTGGDGGAGADADAPATTQYRGRGGTGGNGGGGGGAAGGASNNNVATNKWDGENGIGGAGSHGGTGGLGIAFLYY